MTADRFLRIAPDVKLGRDVKIYGFVNLYGCEIGDETRIGAFVEIQKGVRVGRRCKISSHSFLCEGVEVEDEVFVGHGVMFTNDRLPRATNADGSPQSEADWKCERTLVRRGASIGSGATILPGVTIGARAMVGAGAVVTRDVPEGATVLGSPARARPPRPAPAQHAAEGAVPFVDLAAHHAPIRAEIDAAIARVIDASGFIGGPEVQAFERELAAFAGAKHCVGLANGTDALLFALLACGVGPGDEVITAANTFAATAEAIVQAGAVPRFVDVDPDRLTLDPRLLERAASPRTRAVIPVHLYGRCADMDPILDFARSRGLVVIEDACQAHGASYRGRAAGTLGRAAAFSFYPGKNLGAFGDAGALTTDDDGVADRVRVLREHGSREKYSHEVVGWNGRLDAIQAAILRVKLPRLADGNERRRSRAGHYRRLLAEVPGVRLQPPVADGVEVHHLFVVRVADRDGVRARLADAGIQTGLHYPTPLHLQRAFAAWGRPGDHPASEAAAREGISLPMFPELSDAQVERVCAALARAVGGA